jgi:hypothetical protein
MLQGTQGLRSPWHRAALSFVFQFLHTLASPHPSRGFYENVFLNRCPADVPIRIQNLPFQSTSYKKMGTLMIETTPSIQFSVLPGT